MAELLVIGTGNRLRGDDAAGPRLLDLLETGEARLREAPDLTPELAPEMAGFDAVVFADADPAADRVVLEPLDAAAGAPAFCHSLSPQLVVALSRRLYGFTGRVYLCRIPARDFAPGHPLSPETCAAVAAAARLVRALPVVQSSSGHPARPTG